MSFFSLSLSPSHALSNLFLSIHSPLYLSLSRSFSIQGVPKVQDNQDISCVAFRGVLNFFMVLHPKETHLVMSVIFQGRVRCGPFVFFKKIRTPISWCIFKKIVKLKALSKKNSRIWRCINWKQQNLEGFFPGH